MNKRLSFWLDEEPEGSNFSGLCGAVGASSLPSQWVPSSLLQPRDEGQPALDPHRGRVWRSFLVPCSQTSAGRYKDQMTCLIPEGMRLRRRKSRSVGHINSRREICE